MILQNKISFPVFSFHLNLREDTLNIKTIFQYFKNSFPDCNCHVIFLQNENFICLKLHFLHQVAHLSALYANINQNGKACMIGKNSPMSARREIVLKVCRIKEYVLKLLT